MNQLQLFFQDITREFQALMTASGVVHVVRNYSTTSSMHYSKDRYDAINMDLHLLQASVYPNNLTPREIASSLWAKVEPQAKALGPKGVLRISDPFPRYSQTTTTAPAKSQLSMPALVQVNFTVHSYDGEAARSLHTYAEDCIEILEAFHEPLSPRPIEVNVWPQNIRKAFEASGQSVAVFMQAQQDELDRKYKEAEAALDDMQDQLQSEHVMRHILMSDPQSLAQFQTLLKTNKLDAALEYLNSVLGKTLVFSEDRQAIMYFGRPCLLSWFLSLTA